MEIKFIRGTLNSRRYVEVIDEQINTYATRIAGNKYIFIHRYDDMAVQTTKAVNRHFANKKMHVLER